MELLIGFVLFVIAFNGAIWSYILGFRSLNLIRDFWQNKSLGDIFGGLVIYYLILSICLILSLTFFSYLVYFVVQEVVDFSSCLSIDDKGKVYLFFIALASSIAYWKAFFKYGR